MKTLTNKLIKFLIFISIIIGLLEFVAYFITFNQYKPVIEKVFQDQFDLKVNIKGDIKYKVLPLPHLELRKVSVKTVRDEKLLKASKVGLYFGIISLPTSVENVKLRKIYLDNGIFNLNNIKESIKEDKLDEKIILDTLVITNSSVDILKPDEETINKRRLDKLNLKINKGGWLSNNINIDSNFEIEHQRLNLTANFKDINAKGSSDKALFKFYNDAAELTFEGKLDGILSTPNLLGKIRAKITDLDKFSRYFDDSPYIKTILSKENLIIEGELEASREHIQIRNLNINSANIQQATINSRIEFYQGLESDIDINIDNLNLDNLVATTNSDGALFGKIQKTTQKLLNWFDIDIINNMSLLFNLKINTVVVNSQAISDLLFNFDSFSGNISLNAFEFKFPGGSRFKSGGVVTHNSIRPKFIGDLELVSNDFPKLLSWLGVDKDDDNEKLYSLKKLMMKSEVELIPNDLKLIDIKAALDDILFIGSSNIRRSHEEQVNFYTKLRFNKIDGDYFNLDKMLQELITKLFVSDYDKTGEVYSKLMDDYKWLRKFGSNVDFDITADEFILNKYKYNDFDLSFAISPNMLSINRIFGTSQYANFNGRLSLSLPSFKPLINVNLNFDYLDSNFIDYIIPSQTSLQNALMLHLREREKNKTRTELEAKEDNSIVTGFNFFGINNHDGNIELKASKFVHNRFEASNIDLSSTLTNGLILVNKLDANAFDGQATIKGNIAILSAVPSATFSLALYNVNPGKLTESFSGLNNMSGYLSASGSVNSSGINLPSMISNMQGEFKVIAKKVKVKGLGIGELADISELITPLNDKLQRVNYYVKYGETLFDNIKGSIKIHNGIASFENFILENNRVGGAFAAKYDIYNNEINSILKFSFIPINRPTPLEFQFTSKGLMPNPITTADVAKLIDYISLRAKMIGDANGSIDANVLQDKESVLRKRLR